VGECVAGDRGVKGGEDIEMRQKRRPLRTKQDHGEVAGIVVQQAVGGRVQGEAWRGGDARCHGDGDSCSRGNRDRDCRYLPTRSGPVPYILLLEGVVR
jgi:hypothetical protein